MKVILTTMLFMIAIMSISPVFGLQQETNKFTANLQLGESENFKWRIINESDEPVTIYFSSVNEGKQFLTFVPDQVIEPHSAIFIDVTVNVPDDYDDNVILKPKILAVQKAVVSNASSIINVGVATTIIINIGDNPVEPVLEPVIEDKVPKPVEKSQQTESGGFSINKAPTMDSEPTAEPQPECRAGTEVVDGFCKVIASENEGGSCLIATAAYGTELAPQVQFLREIRDNTVLSTASGTAFMSGFNTLYYSFAPTVADMERENPMFQQTVRTFITPMISTLSIMSLADSGSEAEVLGLGLSVIMINLGMYVGAPIGAFVVLRRQITNRQK